MVSAAKNARRRAAGKLARAKLADAGLCPCGDPRAPDRPKCQPCLTIAEIKREAKKAEQAPVEADARELSYAEENDNDDERRGAW